MVVSVCGRLRFRRIVSRTKRLFFVIWILRGRFYNSGSAPLPGPLPRPLPVPRPAAAPDLAEDRSAGDTDYCIRGRRGSSQNNASRCIDPSRVQRALNIIMHTSRYALPYSSICLTTAIRWGTWLHARFHSFKSNAFLWSSTRSSS